VEITDLLTRDRVVLGLAARDKAQVLRALSHRAGKAMGIDGQVVLDALEAREDMGSTGVGQGVAIPHARIGGLQDFFGLFARLDHPIAFDAIDGQPVDLVFLLLMPHRAGNTQLAALACVSRLLRDRRVASSLRAAGTAAEIHQLFSDVDRQIAHET
jgi:PTS system nitrogen regulatory IIA component